MVLLNWDSKAGPEGLVQGLVLAAVPLQQDAAGVNRPDVGYSPTQLTTQRDESAVAGVRWHSDV